MTNASKMSAEAFAAALALLPPARADQGRARVGAIAVLVYGTSCAAAARAAGVRRSAVRRLVARIRSIAQDGCPVCHRQINTGPEDDKNI